MKAVAVFPGSQQVKLIEQDVPRLSQPNQVLLRLLDVGICGTDKEICSFEYGTPPAGDDHLVIGHESLAEIVQAGPAVERLRVGDLVVPSVRRPCPRRGCLSCRSGHQDYCYTGEFTERGIKEAHGYMTEYVVDYERYMNVVPPDLREIAVLAEPLTIAEKALAQIFWMMQHRPPWLDPQTPSQERGSGLSALVLGIGPVGLLGAMTLAMAGFTTTSTPASCRPTRGSTWSTTSARPTSPPRPRRSRTWPRRSATSTWFTRRSGTPTSPCKRCRSWAPTASS